VFEEAFWFLVIGGLLVLMAIARGLIARLPLTGAMVPVRRLRTRSGGRRHAKPRH
jgi:hypothetical protein